MAYSLHCVVVIPCFIVPLSFLICLQLRSGKCGTVCLSSAICAFLQPPLVLLFLGGGLRQGGGLVWAYNVKAYFRSVSVLKFILNFFLPGFTVFFLVHNKCALFACWDCFPSLSLSLFLSFSPLSLPLPSLSLSLSLSHSFLSLSLSVGCTTVIVMLSVLISVGFRWWEVAWERCWVAAFPTVWSRKGVTEHASGSSSSAR